MLKIRVKGYSRGEFGEFQPFPFLLSLFDTSHKKIYVAMNIDIKAQGKIRLCCYVAILSLCQDVHTPNKRRYNVLLMSLQYLCRYWCVSQMSCLTNKEAYAMYYSLIKQDGHFKTRGKCRLKHKQVQTWVWSTSLLLRVFTFPRRFLRLADSRSEIMFKWVPLKYIPPLNVV